MKLRNTKYYKLEVPIKGIVQVVFLIVFVFCNSCNSENAPNCLQNAGDLTRVQVDVPEFTTITVFENLNLVLKQGEEQLVEVESGEFLINDISAAVEGNRLILRNENGCNIFREYGLSTVYVTSPNLTEVRSSTGLLISSNGPLNYPNLSLVSESFNEPEAETTDGSFDIEVENEQVGIAVNGISYFKLRGTTTNLSVAIAAGDSRIEAEELMAQEVVLNHRGTNDVFVNPQQRISGVIRGYGDVISLNRPSEVEVEELFNGRLIFRD
ncbi:MAG: head GIN domain-containing protein [Bacteroidota bacterium]